MSEKFFSSIRTSRQHLDMPVIDHPDGLIQFKGTRLLYVISVFLNAIGEGSSASRCSEIELNLRFIKAQE
jgi:hypothetical protein